MYNFRITCLGQERIAQLQASTTLVYPLTYEGIVIEKKLGTDCILINGVQYRVPANEMSRVKVDASFVSFGYFTKDE